MADDLKGAMADVDAAKSQLDASYGALKGADPTPVKKWTVTMKDGTVYHGVRATSAEEASRKMAEGPKGPLAGTPGPTRVPRGQASFAGLPELARTAPAAVMGPAGAAATLTMEGTGPEKTPTRGRDVLGDLVPLAAALIPGGRTAGRFARTLGANMLGRGAVEGGAEALNPTGQGPLGAGVSGAIKGVLPGLVQGAVGLGLGPTKDTLQVAKAAGAVKKAVSPEVGALINPDNPASLLSKRTAQKMERAAGVNLDKMEAELEKSLGPKFRVQGVGGSSAQMPALYTPSGTRIPGGLPLTGSQGQTFAEVRSEIKRLREIAKYDKGASTDTAQAAKKDAAKLEQKLLAQMPPALAQRYRKALDAHAKDMDAVRWVRGLQREQALRGGVNPQDRPELAQAERAIDKGGRLRAGIHGSLGAAEALTGRPIGAGYHMGRAADQMRSQGPLRPAQGVSQTVPAITRGILGLGAAQAQKPLMPPPEAQ